MRKWEELTFEEQTKALAVNVPLAQDDTTYTHVSKETAFMQLVSTGPYYFDKQGKVYTGPVATQCPLAKDVANRVWKYDYKSRKSSVVTIAEGLKQRSELIKQEQA